MRKFYSFASPPPLCRYSTEFFFQTFPKWHVRVYWPESSLHTTVSGTQHSSTVQYSTVQYSTVQWYTTQQGPHLIAHYHTDNTLIKLSIGHFLLYFWLLTTILTWLLLTSDYYTDYWLVVTIDYYYWLLYWLLYGLLTSCNYWLQPLTTLLTTTAPGRETWLSLTVVHVRLIRLWPTGLLTYWAQQRVSTVLVVWLYLCNEPLTSHMSTLSCLNCHNIDLPHTIPTGNLDLNKVWKPLVAIRN